MSCNAFGRELSLLQVVCIACSSVQTNLNHLAEKKLREHVEQQLKKRQPGITRLVQKYNSLCKRLAIVNEGGSAPRNAVAPVPIDTKRLFSLDVDSELWNDVGLGQEDDDQQVPQWLGNEQVRFGIRSYLDYCRCLEELA